ncbi:DNA alkylation repair protein [Pontibacillus salicampi]|uniref:DNA alkylation repair protein n=1 Tax=Pontibacillus salicampi TaxID=1449801 RepID=A0ABV6LQV1_9BACI
MSAPYLCPGCKTNRTRFNIIEQVAKSVKKNPQTGEVLEEYAEEIISPMHLQYKGPDVRIQCAACGIIEDEISFIKRAEYNKSS